MEFFAYACSFANTDKLDLITGPTIALKSFTTMFAL